jgi:hypothetical protein
MHEQMIHIISNFTWVTNIVFLGGLHWLISFSYTLEKKNNNNTTTTTIPVAFNGGGITIVSNIQINQMVAFKVQRLRQHKSCN